jgi:hypothetical protein
VCARAAELQIVLHFVPVGMTDEWQPQNRTLVVIKVGKGDAARMLVECWGEPGNSGRGVVTLHCDS